MSANFRNPNFLLPNEVNMATNPALSEDRHSLYSMEFDGVNDIITVNTSTGVDFSNPFTISLWAKWTAADIIDNTAGIIQLAKESQSYSFMIGTGVGSSNNTFSVSWNNNNYEFGGSYGDGNWHNIIVTGNGVNWSGVKVYIDGANVTSSASSISALGVNSTVTYIGQNTYGGNRQFKGLIDEVAMWSSDQSNNVSNIYNGGSPGNIMALPNKPTAYYPLGEQARDNTEWQFPNEVLQSQVFDFDGTDDNVTLSNELSGAGTSSASFWIKRNSSSPADDGGILGLVGSGDTSDYISIALWQGVIQSSVANTTNHKGSTTIAVDTWYHVMVVKNSSATTAIYVNGVAETLSTGGTWVATIDTPQAKIGGVSYSGTSYNFQGEISNVAVWNSDQSLEKDNIYNNGSPASSYTNTPTAWYKLNATNTYAGLNPNFHNALDFSGSNQNINLGNNASLYPGTSDMSYSFWFKSPSFSGYKTIFLQGAANLNVLNQGDKAVFITTLGDELRVFVASNTGGFGNDSNNAFDTSNANFVDNQWYHIVFTLDRDGDAVIYVNGVANVTQAVKSSSSSVDIVDTDNSIIGGVAYDFDGQISNFALFTQAISAEDVLYLYNGGTPQNNISFEPTSWYKLDNLTTGIQDSGSASNNGTNNGATEVTDSVAVNQWNFNNVSQSQTPNWSSALNFRGSPIDYITMGDILTQDGSTAFSISCWVKYTNAGTMMIVSKQDASGYGYLLHTGNSAGVKFTWYPCISAGGSIAVRTSNAYNDGNWHNVLATYDGSGNASGAKIYVDGTLDTNIITDTFTGTSASTGPFQIGARNGTSFPLIATDVSNVAVWSSDQSANKDTIYNSGTPETSLSNSPTSWWKLDNTASGIQDSGSASNNGTNNGATEIQTNVWTPRLNGESDTLPSTALVSSDLQFESPYSNFSLDFDGTGNYIDCGANENILDFSGNDYTVSAWVNWDGTGDSNQMIASVKSSGTAVDFALTIEQSSGKISYWNGSAYAQSNSAIPTGAWCMVTIIVKAGQKDFFINGVADGTPSQTRVASATAGTKFLIGKSNYGSEFFNGNIDEFSVFNKVLTQAEISQVYNNGYAADLTSLSPVSWWRLGEDAYFVGNDITIPNQISGAPNGTGAGTQTSILVADAPGSYASGVGTNLADTDRKGEAPESSANSQSINMIPGDVHPYTPGYVPAQVNNVDSMNFDGTDQYFNLGTSLNSTINGVVNNFSISCWIRANTGSGSVRRGIIGNYTTASGIGFYLDLINSSANAFTLRAGYHGASGYNLRDNTTTLVANGSAWYNVIVTISGNTSGDVVVYINGIAENGTIIFSSPSSYTATTNLEVGHIAHGPSNRFSGDIDEVAIFDYALTPKQIKEDIYNASTTGKAADLNNNSNLTAPVAWYRMGD